MFKSCLKNYLIAVGILVLSFVSFFGYRAYQGNIEFENFMSVARAFQQSIDKDTLSPDYTEEEHHAPDLQEDDFIPMVKVMKHKDMEPGANSSFFPADKDMEARRSFSPAEMVKKRVQTPDGEIHTIWLPPGHKVKDGGEVSEAFFNLPPPPNFEAVKGIRFRKSDIPEGESIESYGDKLFLSRLYGVSIEDVEKMIEGGTIQLPKVIARSVDEFSVDEFMDHDHNLQSSGGVEYLDKAPRRSDNSQLQISTPPSEGVSDAQKMPASSTASHEELSRETFDKEQQLIDQYGMEEGLRRLREMDPEAARQFESVPRPGRERRPPPAREVSSKTEPSTQ